jgi:recombination protein RecT
MKITNQSIAPTNGAIGTKKPFSQIIAMPSYQTMLANAIQDPTRRQRFITTVISAVNATPALKNCTPDSIITAALQMESLGLPYGMGDAYIIPYGDKATFQIGARGYITLAMRSGAYQDIDTIEIREGEFKGRDKRSGKPMFEFIEDEDVREDLPIIGYLAHFTLLNGFQAQEYFSKYKMLKWANRYSQAFDIELYNRYVVYQETGEGLTDKELRLCSAPWYETFDEMAFKTVLKRLLSKKGILSVELVEAFKKDKSDGTTDGTMEMNFVGQDEEQTAEETAEEPKVEEKEQTSRKGRPAKVVANVVPDDAKPQATKPFDMKNTMEFDGDF